MSRTAPTPVLTPISDHPDLKVMVDAPMGNMTTWRIGGPADFSVRADHPDKVIAALRWAHDEGLPVTIIGGGSNLLVGDGGIRGLVVIARTPGERAEQLLTATDLGEAVCVRVAAQAPSPGLAAIAPNMGGPAWNGDPACRARSAEQRSTMPARMAPK